MPSWWLRARDSLRRRTQGRPRSCSRSSAWRLAPCRSCPTSRRRGSASSPPPARSGRSLSCSAARVEVEGIVVTGDASGGTLGFPTANLRIEHSLLVPAFGIYAGAARDHRAAVSIGVNPHYGGAERRIEAFLLDFEGDLYGQRVIVELWDRLRDEAVFGSEQALIDQIAADVEATRAATRP